MITAKRFQYIKKTLFVLEGHVDAVLMGVKRQLLQANIDMALFTMNTQSGHFAQFVINYIYAEEGDETFTRQLKQVALEHIEADIDISHYGYFCGFFVDALCEQAEKYFDIDISDFRAAWTMLYVTLANQIILLSQDIVTPEAERA